MVSVILFHINKIPLRHFLSLEKNERYGFLSDAFWDTYLRCITRHELSQILTEVIPNYFFLLLLLLFVIPGHSSSMCLDNFFFLHSFVFDVLSVMIWLYEGIDVNYKNQKFLGKIWFFFLLWLFDGRTCFEIWSFLLCICLNEFVFFFDMEICQRLRMCWTQLLKLQCKMRKMKMKIIWSWSWVFFKFK